MKFNLSVHPNEINKQTRICIESEEFMPYTGAYIGELTYCANLQVDNGIEFEAHRNRLCYNLQIGKYNSIGQNLQCVFGRNHNYKKISTGAVDLMLQKYDVQTGGCPTYNQKGSIIIQNDIWFGENVTIMPGTIVRNGAVVARNSHVVSDVPPYAIVGGNPSKVIGYRYPKEYIDKLQKIAWWDWTDQRIIKNASYFTEDVESFCNAFFEEANREFEDWVSKRNVEEDVYFAFVDYYENYSSFPNVIESFLDWNHDKKTKLILFIQDDERVEAIGESLFDDLLAITKEVNREPDIQCSIELEKGTFEDAKSCFLNCSHYIVTRTYDAVSFSCLADQLNIEIISGVDGAIQFEKKNLYYKNL